jgi:hypothetical protein
MRLLINSAIRTARELIAVSSEASCSSATYARSCHTAKKLESALWSSFSQSKTPVWAADVPLHPCSSWILSLLSRGRQQETR